MFSDVMIDLETLGTVPGCAIVSIGAVAFNEFEVQPTGFYQAVSIPEWSVAGLTPEGLHKDESTIGWWQKQSSEARRVFEEGHFSTRVVLSLLADYISDIGSPRVWGNGADFDNPIVAAAAHKVGLNPKSIWKGYNGRCYRTVKSQFQDIKLVRTGTHHNALDDAISQAQHMVRICQNRGWRLC